MKNLELTEQSMYPQRSHGNLGAVMVRDVTLALGIGCDDGSYYWPGDVEAVGGTPAGNLLGLAGEIVSIFHAKANQIPFIPFLGHPPPAR